MGELPGMIRPELQALPQVKDRMTFLYLEHCTLISNTAPWDGRTAPLR